MSVGFSLIQRVVCVGIYWYIYSVWPFHFQKTSSKQFSPIQIRISDPVKAIAFDWFEYQSRKRKINSVFLCSSSIA